MPYITPVERNRLDLDWHIHQLADRIATPGQFAYVLYRLLNRLTMPRNYAILSQYSGVVTETLAEFRRRVIVPYEDEKMRENGDV